MKIKGIRFKRGGILIMVLMLVSVFITMGFYLYNYSKLNFNVTRNEIILVQAKYVGESALRHAIAILRKQIPFSSHFTSVEPPLIDEPLEVPSNTYDILDLPTRISSLDEAKKFEFNNLYRYSIFIWSYDPVNFPNVITIKIIIFYKQGNKWIPIKAYKSTISV